ncbi:MAG: polysaccharide pyruvyl transferase family protein [Acidobacteriota bacterium]
MKIALFGHFGVGNFGNEATLQAMLCNLRRFMPEAEISAISTAPEIVTERYGISAVSINAVIVRQWKLSNPVSWLARKLIIGIASELYRWLKGIKTLWNQHMLVVVGTGLLTDAFGLGAWGPYNVFKWALIAKLCRCRLMFVSVGAGPLNSRRGRFFVKSALALANYRSYRDVSTREYLRKVGFEHRGDAVYPDLAFSLPGCSQNRRREETGRPVVGLGLMLYAAMYGVEETTEAHYDSYIRTLVSFVGWILKHQYDVRLLIGDLSDIEAVQQFERLLQVQLSKDDVSRVKAEPIGSVDDLLRQLNETDFVVATRFHNALLALYLDKPTTAISFHHKCSSLMKEMGLSEYYQDINTLSSEKLIEQFCNLEKNASKLRAHIKRKADECRTALDDQYNLILRGFLTERGKASENPVTV